MYKSSSRRIPFEQRSRGQQWAAVGFFVVCIGFLGWQILKGLLTGVFINYSRHAPPHIYNEAHNPTGFWSMIAFAAALLLFCVGLTIRMVLKMGRQS
ncbi:MAG: hypothetical protein KF735_18215 [Chelatococcus sp.]|jgi:hypothetical protein|uniref:hypothetical protein n=1 Tax=Chelatococcus sp. TaxID=1953771 RepID=UPI0025C41639|nr:hypothetical protein [Chelatococcus sp.]MBX3539583.1 hypothetical protein [Chelatococcus sp.]